MQNLRQRYGKMRGNCLCVSVESSLLATVTMFNLHLPNSQPIQRYGTQLVPGDCSSDKSELRSQLGKIGPGDLRAPCVAWPLLLAQAACVRHACLRAPCVAWPLLSPTTGLFNLFFFFFLFRLLLLTNFGEIPMCEIIFVPIFCHNQKMYANCRSFLFFYEKN